MAKTIEELEDKLKKYEQNGAAKLYYSLNRKMNEMADLLNGTKLGTLQLDDKNDRTFERLKNIWDSAAKVAEAAKLLGQNAGVISGDEAADTERKPFVDTIAQSRT